MDGSPNGKLITVADAKTRVLELGQRPPSTLLGNPIVRAAALVAAGALLGRSLGKRGSERTIAAVGRIAAQSGVALAPLLLEIVVPFLRGRRAPPDGSAQPPPDGPRR